MSCGVGHKHSSDPKMLWPWRRLVAAAPTGPLAGESPCATDAALKREKDQKKKKKSLHLLIPNSQSIPHPPLLLGKHKSVLYVCESVKVLLIVESLDLKSTLGLGFVGQGLKHYRDVHPNPEPCVVAIVVNIAVFQILSL